MNYNWANFSEDVLNFKFIITCYSVGLSLYGIIKSIPKIKTLWITRNLRKVWSLSNGENVIIVCSELDEPEKEQLVSNEFIYHRKYGDLDAYMEVVQTLLRLYPKLRLKILSCGEAANIKMEFEETVILIGGPDFNSYTESFLEKEKCQFYYRGGDTKEKSSTNPENIVLHHRNLNREFCEIRENRDYGYFERIVNPHNHKKWIIFIGGCKTIGVTAAAKAFSWVPTEDGKSKNIVLPNAKKVVSKIGKNSEFAVLIKGERSNQSVLSSKINEENIFPIKGKAWYHKAFKRTK